MRVVALAPGSSDEERSREESMLRDLEQATQGRDELLVVFRTDQSRGPGAEDGWLSLRDTRTVERVLAEAETDVVVTLGTGSAAAALAARYAGVPHVWWPGVRIDDERPSDSSPSTVDDLVSLSTLVIAEDAREGLRESLRSARDRKPAPMRALPAAFDAWLALPDVVVESLTARGAWVDPRTSRTWVLGDRVLRPVRRLARTIRGVRVPR